MRIVCIDHSGRARLKVYVPYRLMGLCIPTDTSLTLTVIGLSVVAVALAYVTGGRSVARSVFDADLSMVLEGTSSTQDTVFGTPSQRC